MSTEVDFEDRELCPDGSCIGLIGEDGRCKVCGRAKDPASAQARERVSAEMPSAESLEHDASDDAFEDDDRHLCPDGACIGLLGSDGKCKVCGRSAGS